MELATLITECVKLTDDAHRANNAGHPDDAKKALNKMFGTLHRNIDQIQLEPEPEPEKPSDIQEPSGPQDGDG